MLPALQQVQDPAVDQNFRQVLLNWPADAPLVTAVPTGAGDGTRVMFQTAGMAALTPPLMWELRFTAAGWVPIGAAPLFSEVKPYTSLTAPDEGTTTVNSYAALATAGPAVTLPAPGWYDIEIGFGAYHSVAGNALAMSYDIDATGAVDADCCMVQMAVANVDGVRGVRTRRKQFAAASVLTAKYKTAAATATFRGPRYMMATPVLL